MQRFADEELSEWQRRFGPLQRQIMFVESQLGDKVTITQDQLFQILAICEHWPKPDKYLAVWAIGNSDIDDVAIFVPGEEPINGGTQFAVSPTGKLLNYQVTGPNGTDVRAGWHCVIHRSLRAVPLLGRSGTSSAD